MSQRFLLEMFFLRVIEELYRRDIINSSNFLKDYFPGCFNTKGKRISNPSKSAVENLLRKDHSLWHFIKSTIGLQCDLPEKMNNYLLYGELSKKLHLRWNYRLYIPSDTSSDTEVFFLELARVFDCPTETIDMHSVASRIYRNDGGIWLFLFSCVQTRHISLRLIWHKFSKE